MQDKFLTAGLLHFLDEITQEIIAVKIINADAGFYGDGNVHRTLHLLYALCNQFRVCH